MSASKSLKEKGNYSLARADTMRRVTQGGPSPETIMGRGIDVLRTSYWFEVLRHHLKVDTAYAVGKQVRPETYKKSPDNDLYHHNLWARYAQGQQRPGPRTLKAAEGRVPVAGLAFRHPLWEALNTSRSIAASGDALFRRLHPHVQRAIFEPKALEFQQYRRRPTLQRCLNLLESYAGLDALCALVILLREAQAAERADETLAIGRSLYHMQLMLSCQNKIAQLALALAIYLETIIYPLANDGEVGYDVAPLETLRTAALFGIRVVAMEDSGRIRSVNGGSSRDWHRIFCGAHGWDLLFGFSPKYKLTVPVAKASVQARRNVASHEVARQWGHEVLREFRSEPVMPEKVMKAVSTAIIEPLATSDPSIAKGR